MDKDSFQRQKIPCLSHTYVNCLQHLCSKNPQLYVCVCVHIYTCIHICTHYSFKYIFIYYLFLEQQRATNGSFIGANVELTPGYSFSERERYRMCVHCSTKCVKRCLLKPMCSSTLSEVHSRTRKQWLPLRLPLRLVTQ